MTNIFTIVDMNNTSATNFNEGIVSSSEEDESSSSSSSSDDDSTIISILFLLYSILMVVTIVASKFLHDRPTVSAILPEAGMIIAIGFVAGLIVNVTLTSTTAQQVVAKSLLTFSSEVFFVGLLPPIIFNSGYHLRRELFYRHFSPICLFAVFGTIISTLVITLILYFATSTLRLSSFQPTFFELLTFGSLISTTDPVTTLAVLQVKRVDPQIFYLVFGESALNDAIGLVLFQQCSKLLGTVSTATDLSQSTTRELAIGFATNFSYCVIGSPIVGIILGIGVAYLFKCIDMRENALLELALYIFLLYVPYLVGEILGLSGIVVVLFSGITAKQYCVPNLSEITNMNSDFIFRLIAFLAETAIFLELGLSIVGLTGYFHFKFILCALLACLVGRAANIYPLTAIHNWTIRRRDGVDRPYSSAPAPVHEETTSLLGTEHPTLVRNISTKTHNKMFYMSEGTPSERGDLKIHSNSAHMLWFAGLRGAVAYACVRNFPDTYGNRDSFTMTTMMVILATTFLLGATTAPVLRLLDIETDVCEDSYMNTWSMQRSLPDYIVKLQNFIQSHVCRASDEDDEVFTTTGNNFQTSNLTSSIRRRSSINVAKSVRWEGAGLYDFGMD